MLGEHKLSELSFLEQTFSHLHKTQAAAAGVAVRAHLLVCPRFSCRERLHRHRRPDARRLSSGEWQHVALT